MNIEELYDKYILTSHGSSHLFALVCGCWAMFDTFKRTTGAAPVSGIVTGIIVYIFIRIVGYIFDKVNQWWIKTINKKRFF